jgi:ADP-heptose:LPS heptosyltransferase
MDWTAELHDFADTAALIEALVLVISVDTRVAHTAGTSGRPVWALNRFDRCWRWMMDRADRPWYPTMRLFAQTRLRLRTQLSHHLKSMASVTVAR